MADLVLGLQKDTDFIVAGELCSQFTKICFHVGEVIRVHAFFEEVAGKHRQQAFQLGNPTFGGRIVPGPVFQMFFRPEENHGTSSVRNIRHPFGYGKGYMTDHSFRIGFFDDAVAHYDGDGFTAIETGGIDPDLFARKQPADRQRFESSLREPLLLTVNGDTKLGG